MELIKEHYIIHQKNGEVFEFDIDHIFVDTGHFCNMNGKPCGWHIQLGTNDSADNYSHEFSDEWHDIPDELPTVELYEE